MQALTAGLGYLYNKRGERKVIQMNFEDTDAFYYQLYQATQAGPIFLALGVSDVLKKVGVPYEIGGIIENYLYIRWPVKWPNLYA